MDTQKDFNTTLPAAAGKKGHAGLDFGTSEKLKKHYRLLNVKSIVDYLNNDAELLEILLEAPRRIAEVFAEGFTLTLNLFNEPESEEGGTHLAVRIVNNLEIAEARENLKKFNREWWFKQNKKIFDKIAFGLDFK